MTKLSRWFPFMFRRDESREESKEGQKKAHAVLTKAHRGRPTAMSPYFGPPMMQPLLSDPFFRDPFSHFAELDRWFGDFSPARFQPNVDVTDEEDALRVTAELPGMNKDDVDVRIEDGVLRVQGEKKNETESNERGVYRSERYYGHFERAIPLPADVDQSAVDANFKNGVLSVRVPKSSKPHEEARRVQIKG